MEISEQVVSLKLAKRLKELGYPQEGLWYWVKECWDLGKCDKKLMTKSEMSVREDYNRYTYKVICTAPTVAELGEWLPEALFGEENIYILYEDCCVIEFVSFGGYFYCNEKTEANARARILIWLVENGYVSFENQMEGENEKR